jgi:signal transduction histidine kinase
MRADRKLNALLLDAAIRERQLLAQDLHDTLCQNLVGLSLLVKLLVKRVEAGKPISLEEVNRINAGVEEAIEHSRAPLRAQFVSQTKEGLVKALQELAHLAGRKLECRLALSPGVVIRDERVAQVLYRIAEEAVREATRGPFAKELALSLAEEGDEVRLEVRGDGVFPMSDEREAGDGLLKSFADAVGIELVIEREAGCLYRAVASNGDQGVAGPSLRSG